MRTVIFGLATVAALVANNVAAHAVTCEQVRALSRAEQEYWAKKLNITPAQRQEIYLRCYKNYQVKQRNARN